MSRNRSVWLLIIAVAFVATQLCSCAGGKKRVAKDPRLYYREHDLGHLPKFDIPVEVNERVIAWMEYFQGPGQGHFKRYLERSGRYIPLMQEILKKHNLPKDLVYIALIESGFNTQARSFASAVGPWQFIYSTGKRYGLRIDGWVDERRDPYKSTEAAAKYFKDLYGEFKDWYLSMAGYNAGEGRVRSAIEITGSKNFWDMADDRKAFRPETRDYVPKYIAAAIIAKMPEKFGFPDVEYKESFDYETGTVDTQTDLSVIAKCAGVSEEDIQDLNPHLVRGSTPPDEKNYTIRLPRGTMRTFKEKYAALPKEDRIMMVRHEVRRGETITKIAKHYGVNAFLLAEANNLPLSRRALKPGTSLIIPKGIVDAHYEGASSEPTRGGVKHTVKRGETLNVIAKHYKVLPSQIIAWNYLKSAKSIRTGMQLVIKKPHGKVSDDTDRDDSDTAVAKGMHKVQRGETLAMIAGRYGVTVNQLLALNHLRSPNVIEPGMKLMIRKTKALPQSATPVALSNTSKSSKASAGHKVQKGETLSTIAKKYNVTTKQLLAMNNIRDPRYVKAGMNIIVQAEQKAPEKNVLDKDAKNKNKLKKVAEQVENEAIQTFEKNKEVDTSAEANVGVSTQGNLKGEGESENVKIPSPASASTSIPAPTSIPDPAASPAPAPVSAPTAVRAEEMTKKTSGPIKLAELDAASRNKTSGRNPSTYHVKSGDTLWTIARRHNMTIAELQKLNNLKDPSVVKPGVVLKVFAK